MRASAIAMASTAMHGVATRKMRMSSQKLSQKLLTIENTIMTMVDIVGIKTVRGIVSVDFHWKWMTL